MDEPFLEEALLGVDGYFARQRLRLFRVDSDFAFVARMPESVDHSGPHFGVAATTGGPVEPGRSVRPPGQYRPIASKSISMVGSDS